jgi:hypothetical protein
VTELFKYRKQRMKKFFTNVSRPITNTIVHTLIIYIEGIGLLCMGTENLRLYLR